MSDGLIGGLIDSCRTWAAMAVAFPDWLCPP
jgi:hypothetical protein